MTDRKKMATQAELAEYLDVPQKTLIDWRYRRIGPPWLKLGHHVRYPWPAVDKWITDNLKAAS